MASGVPRPREQRRVADRRHYYRGAGSPVRQLHAKLSKSHSAWTPGNTPNRRKNRTILFRSNLRRLVAGECFSRCQNRGRAFSGTLPRRDRRDVIGILLWPRFRLQRRVDPCCHCLLLYCLFVDFHSTVSDLANITQIVTAVGGGIWLLRRLVQSHGLAIQKKI